MEQSDSIQINLNSKFARRLIENSRSNCIFELPNLTIPSQHHIHVSIINAIIPYSFYNVNYLTNTLTYTVDTTATYTINVPEGNYNSFQMATYLKSHMTNFNVTYDAVTNKYTFTHTASLNFSIDSSSSILKILGFTEGVHISSSYILTSNQVANLQRIQSIHIQSNFLTGNINSSDIFRQNTLCTIPVNTAPNSNIVYYNDNKFTTNLYSNILNEIEIKLVDQDNMLLDLNGLDWSLTLQLDIVDFVN
jgi:hypothetical protein